MSKEMTKKEEAALVSAEDAALWDNHDGGAQEVVIGKVLMQQGQSERVSNSEAKLGDYINSLTGEKVGDFDTDFSLIPFMFNRRYIVSKKTGSRFVFERFDDITAANEKAEWFFMENGVEMKREYLREFYCMNPECLDMPVIVGFKSTSANVGKNIYTQMFIQNKAAGLIPPSYHISLGSKKESKDGSAFAVSTVKRGPKSTKEEIQACIQWMKHLKSNDVKVDNSDVVDSAEGSQQF